MRYYLAHFGQPSDFQSLLSWRMSLKNQTSTNIECLLEELMTSAQCSLPELAEKISVSTTGPQFDARALRHYLNALGTGGSKKPRQMQIGKYAPEGTDEHDRGALSIVKAAWNVGMLSNERTGRFLRGYDRETVLAEVAQEWRYDHKSEPATMSEWSEVWARAIKIAERLWAERPEWHRRMVTAAIESTGDPEAQLDCTAIGYAILNWLNGNRLLPDGIDDKFMLRFPVIFP